MNQLQLFYENKAMNEAVRQFLGETMRKLIVEESIAGKDASGTAKAQKVIDQAFADLKDAFEPKKAKNITNKAR